MPRQRVREQLESIARAFGVPLESLLGNADGRGRTDRAIVAVQRLGTAARSTTDVLTEIDELLTAHGSSSGYGKRWPYQGSF